MYALVVYMVLESRLMRFLGVDVQTKHQNRDTISMWIVCDGLSNENRVQYESCGKFNIRIDRPWGATIPTLFVCGGHRTIFDFDTILTVNETSKSI